MVIGKSLLDGEKKYKDIYAVASSNTSADNYNENRSKYGDAIYETSSTGGGLTSWYSGRSLFGSDTYPFFIRGGEKFNGGSYSIFDYESGKGGMGGAISFHLVLPVL